MTGNILIHRLMGVVWLVVAALAWSGVVSAALYGVEHLSRKEFLPADDLRAMMVWTAKLSAVGVAIAAVLEVLFACH